MTSPAASLLTDADLFDPTAKDLFALLRERRGWSDERLAEIDDPSHDTLKDMDLMVQALHETRRRGLKITIAPDFDMDGIASGVLGYAGLSELGFDVEMHVPDYRRGHELSPEDIEEIHQQWPDTRVLITCDGGVNSHAGIAAARAKGWMTLVTDHHQELEPGSSADVTVDPCRLDETYSNPGICGAHVLYQVLIAYTRAHQPEKMWEMRLLRLFAGLGTVSDVMPLLFENRQMVRDAISLTRLLWVAPPASADPYEKPDPDQIDVAGATLLQLLDVDPHHPVFVRALRGFALVLKAFTQIGKIRDVDSLDEGFFGFYLAPAMNHPRRIGAPLEPCFDVFLAEDPERQLEAAHEVIAGNEERKALTIQHLEELVGEGADQPLAPWVYFSSAYSGMFGLLANKLMHSHGHPVVVMGRPTSPSAPASGSGRAPVWFEIITTLDAHAGMSAVGHQQACGVRVDRADRLGELIEVLRTATALAQAEIDPAARVGDLLLGPSSDCDSDLTDLDALAELARQISELAPFGHGFEEPVMEVCLEPLGLRIDRIGSEKQHLRLVTRSGLACLWWNSVEEHYETLREVVDGASREDSGTLRFTAKVQLNEFRGETRVQVVIDQLLALPQARELVVVAPDEAW